MGLFDIFSFSNAISQIGESYSIIGESRHTIARNVIEKYANSKKSLDQLALALAYEREGAKYRQEAIKCFEFYFENPKPVPKNPHTKKPYFTQWELHSTLSTLYEKEYQFDKAIKELEKCIEINKHDVNGADYTRIADILVKSSSVDVAIAYLEDIKKKPVYKKIKNAVDYCYSNLEKKKATGYKYKPRKKKAS